MNNQIFDAIREALANADESILDTGITYPSY
ncbi:hypothetical protein F989_00175 [Acinetobacter parvus NIPH 1103]|uniref:Uncharacterized protein n=1 Tax=Acinetobacter parvus NIPH 1103 TaxID=1217671 RepID=N8Q8D7_9GAMM|nr:hypothetical protein F989_00175 [Acinetobacter parvus NIPH 1103]